MSLKNVPNLNSFKKLRYGLENKLGHLNAYPINIFAHFNNKIWNVLTWNYANVVRFGRPSMSNTFHWHILKLLNMVISLEVSNF